MADTTEGSCLTERTKKEKTVSVGQKRQILASRPDRKVGSRLGPRQVAGVMWAHTERNEARLILSTSPQMDRQRPGQYF